MRSLVSIPHQLLLVPHRPMHPPNHPQHPAARWPRPHRPACRQQRLHAPAAAVHLHVSAARAALSSCNPAQHSCHSFDLACSLPASPRDPPAGGPLHWPSASHRMPNEPYWARDDGTSRTTTGQTAPGELVRLSSGSAYDVTGPDRPYQVPRAELGPSWRSGLQRLGEHGECQPTS